MGGEGGFGGRTDWGVERLMQAASRDEGSKKGGQVSDGKGEARGERER